ncbi:MAG: cbb3-type cytochrome c oxidase subunit I, partial [Pseudomonadota bacterium]
MSTPSSLSASATRGESSFGRTYEYDLIKLFTVASIGWGILGMLAGVYIASELAWPALNGGIAEITFGRLRPVHTNLVIFGFGGNALIATSLYIVQRTCQARLWGPGWLHHAFFWLWQILLVIG